MNMIRQEYNVKSFSNSIFQMISYVKIIAVLIFNIIKFLTFIHLNINAVKGAKDRIKMFQNCEQ